MKNELNERFLQTIEGSLPEDVNVAAFLMETLHIGKEAAYRRLRNEVQLSFQDIAIICKTLGLSLDHFLGNYKENSAVFHFNMITLENAMVDYYNTLSRYLELMKNVKDDPDYMVTVVSSTVPNILFSKYAYIARFRICRWLHQNENLRSINALSDVELPESIMQLQNRLCNEIYEMKHIVQIWEPHIFMSLINEIRYFYTLRIITRDDVRNLKEELIDLLEMNQRVATEGLSEHGREINTYLSNINFDVSYTLFEKEDYQFGVFRLYSVNTMDTMHPGICKLQKGWIQSLKRYSTLISQSGEMQRISFFNEQRKYLETLET